MVPSPSTRTRTHGWQRCCSRHGAHSTGTAWYCDSKPFNLACRKLSVLPDSNGPASSVPPTGVLDHASIAPATSAPRDLAAPSISSAAALPDRNVGYLSLSFIPLLWGTYNPCIRYLYAEVDPLDPASLTAVRTVLSAGALLLPVFVGYLLKEGQEVWRRNQQRANESASAKPGLDMLTHPLVVTLAAATDGAADGVAAVSAADELAAGSGTAPESLQQLQPSRALLAAPVNSARLGPFMTRTFDSVILGGLELGLLNFLGTALQVEGLHSTSATRAGFLAEVTAVLTPLVSYLAGYDIPRQMWLAVGVGLIGSTMVAYDTSQVQETQPVPAAVSLAPAAAVSPFLAPGGTAPSSATAVLTSTFITEAAGPVAADNPSPAALPRTETYNSTLDDLPVNAAALAAEPGLGPGDLGTVDSWVVGLTAERGTEWAAAADVDTVASPLVSAALQLPDALLPRGLLGIESMASASAMPQGMTADAAVAAAAETPAAASDLLSSLPVEGTWAVATTVKDVATIAGTAAATAAPLQVAAASAASTSFGAVSALSGTSVLSGGPTDAVSGVAATADTAAAMLSSAVLSRAAVEAATAAAPAAAASGGATPWISTAAGAADAASSASSAVDAATVALPALDSLAMETIGASAGSAAFAAAEGTATAVDAVAAAAITAASAASDAASPLAITGGETYLLLACLFYSICTVRMGIYAPRMDTVRLASMKKVGLSSMSVLWMAANNLRNGVAPESVLTFPDLTSRTPMSIAVLMYSGLGPGALATYLQVSGLSTVPATTAQVIYSMTPLCTAFFAYLILGGEATGPVAWAGGSLIVFAALMAADAQQKQHNQQQQLQVGELSGDMSRRASTLSGWLSLGRMPQSSTARRRDPL